MLATFAYDDLGRRTSLTRGNGTSTSYSYDAISRLSQLADDASGSSHDQTLGFSYSPASQIVQNTRSNDLFAWTGHGSGSTSSTANGLNQITAIGGTSTSHDARGNMTADGLGKAFGYTSENLLTSASGGVTAAYDPAMRLYQVTGAATTRFGYDGVDAIGEYNGSNSLLRRYVHGPGTDEPIVWYEGSGTSDRRFLHADERGSIVAVSNGSGTVTNVNTYDEYGKPGSSNVGRFQYTGQKWISELGLYDYKARMYHPALGRFPQTDPIGYGDGMNMYNAMGSDPVNFTDPWGLQKGAKDCPDVDQDKKCDPPIVITAKRPFSGAGGASGGRGGGTPARLLPYAGPPLPGKPAECADAECSEIIVTGRKLPRQQRLSVTIADDSLAKRAAKCAAQQLGIEDLAEVGLVAIGQPIPGTKRFVTPGSSRGTSIAGLAANSVLGSTRLPVRMPTLVGGPGTGRALAIAGTKSAARFAARAVPVLGWALLAYDAASIAACTAKGD